MSSFRFFVCFFFSSSWDFVIPFLFSSKVMEIVLKVSEQHSQNLKCAVETTITCADVVGYLDSSSNVFRMNEHSKNIQIQITSHS